MAPVRAGRRHSMFVDSIATLMGELTSFAREKAGVTNDRGCHFACAAQRGANVHFSAIISMFFRIVYEHRITGH